MIEDTITQMVSHQLGAIIRIITLINITTGHLQIATRVAIIVTDQITITTMVMIGTRGSQHITKSQFRNQQQFNPNNQARRNHNDHPASFNGNDRHMGHSNYNSTSSLSDVSSFVTRHSVTFDTRRNQGFPNACTVK